jgi:hypothetical protein
MYTVGDKCASKAATPALTQAWRAGGGAEWASTWRAGVVVVLRWGPAGTPPAEIELQKSEKGRVVWTAKLFSLLRLKASLKSAVRCLAVRAQEGVLRVYSKRYSAYYCKGSARDHARGTDREYCNVQHATCRMRHTVHTHATRERSDAGMAYRPSAAATSLGAP